MPEFTLSCPLCRHPVVVPVPVKDVDHLPDTAECLEGHQLMVGTEPLGLTLGGLEMAERVKIVLSPVTKGRS